MNSNGHGSNGESRRTHNDALSLFGSESAPPPVHAFDPDHVMRKLRDLTFTVDRLLAVVVALVKSQSTTKVCVESNGKALEYVVALVEKALVPMAELNRSLSDRDRDLYVIAPVVNALAQILDRHEVELVEAERGVKTFMFIEECRSMDKAEMIAVLQVLGIEQFAVVAGTKLDPSTSSVKHVRYTHDALRHGKVSKAVRPGYRRVSDNWVIRRAWVEVFGPDVSQH